MDLNFTSTDPYDLLWTTLLPTTFDFDPTKVPKEPTPGPPKGKEPAEQPAHHSERLELKQALAVTAVVIISLSIILSLLQIVICKNCWPDFKKQFSHRSGKVLFALFTIAFFLFYTNAIVFTSFIFHFESLSEDPYAITLIFSMVPYRLGKLCMSLFFIFRLHFVFKDSALRINKWIIWSLVAISIIAAICAVYSGIGGPLKSIGNAIETSTTALALTIFVDIIVMIYYVQRLVNVAVMQGKITRKTSMKCSRTGDKVQEVIELQIRKSYTDSKIPVGNISMDLDALKPPTVGDTPVGDDDDDDDNGMIKKAYTGIEEETRIKVHVDKAMIGTVTKSTLLSLIGILTSMWLNIEMVVFIARGETDGVTFRAIASFDGAMNLICMYLIFGFAKPYYDFGCHFCHLGMEGLCKKFSKRQVIRKNSRGEI